MTASLSNDTTPNYAVTLANFGLAIDSKLGACDLVRLQVCHRAIDRWMG
jgi:hypothetical protein